MARDALFPDGLVRPKAPYSPVVVSGDLVYTAGQVAFDASGTCRRRDRQQTTQVLANLRACLLAAGCTLDDVVKVNVFLLDLAEFDAFNEVYRAAFAEPYPVRTTVQAGLPAGSGSRSRRSHGSRRRDRGRHTGTATVVGLANRPHVETHESVEIARGRVALGARGITRKSSARRRSWPTRGGSTTS